MYEYIQDYLNGESIASISRRSGRSYDVLSLFFRKNGVTIRPNFTISKELETIIIELYLSGLSCKNVGEKVGVSTTSVRMVLIRNNIARKKPHWNSRKYKCDDTFFDCIDTEEKAYFFGLLYADGSVNKRLTNISITLQDRDKDILEKLTQYIQPDKSLYFQDLSNRKDGVSRRNAYRLEISSIPMCNVLNSYGMVPRKSLIKTFPEVILNSNEDIKRHFIRGYYDGNGSLQMHLSKNDYLDGSALIIASTYEMCLSLNSIFHVYVDVGTSINKIKKDNYVNAYTVYSCKIYNCEKILDWLYKDSTIYMSRKYLNYLKFREKMNSRRLYKLM